MPIVDVELVCRQGAQALPVSAQQIADALGRVFASPPGTTWVRLHTLSSTAYAENEAFVDDDELPAFVTVLHARLPEGDALATEVLAVSRAVAACIGRTVERVHVQYAAQAAGRQAFGGRLIGPGSTTPQPGADTPG